MKCSSRFPSLKILFIGYVRNNLPEKSIELFEKIPEKQVDEIIAGIFFNACAKCSNASSTQIGREVLHRLPKSFLRNQKLINSAIEMFIKSGHVKDAEELFDKSPQKTIVTYAIMMQGLIHFSLRILFLILR